MKKLFRIFTVLTVIALIAMSAACSKSADTTPTSAATAPPTEAATVAPKPTDPAAPTAAPTAAATVAPTEAPADAPDTSSDDLAALTASRWQLSTVEHDGEESDPMYYGSVIRQTGAYLQFNTDGTFSCVLGMVGCEGTYSLTDGDLTVNITTVYDGKTEKGSAADEVQTLPWNKEAGTIQLRLNNVTNTFRQV